MSGAGRKRKKGWYHAMQAKRARKGQYLLMPDMTGFLISFNHRHKEAIGEALNLLQELLDEEEEKASDGKEGNDSDDMDDIEAALQKEKKNLSQSESLKVVDCGVQNLLFVRTKFRDPVKLATKLLRGVAESKAQRTRYLMRLLPVELTCKAYEEQVAVAAKKVFPRWFQTNDISYCIIFKSRLNESFDREDAIRVLGGIVRSMNTTAKVEYKERWSNSVTKPAATLQTLFFLLVQNPDVVISVEVMKSICCLSVLPDYFKFKRYNLIALASSEPSSSDKDESSVEPPVGQVTGEDAEGGHLADNSITC